MQLWGLLWGPLPQTSQFRHPAHCQALRATAARDGLEVQWQEHELGSYPTIVLLWEDAMRGTPWNYLERCLVALPAYENGRELPRGRSMRPGCSQMECSAACFGAGRGPVEQRNT